MQLTLNPEQQRFIEQQIQEGRFQSAEALVEEALRRMMDDPDDLLSESVLDAIDASEDAIERGEVRDWPTVREELRKKYLS